MARLFGTDGVRGEANVTLLPEMAYRLGRAATIYFGKESEEQPLIIIGRDTRISGEMFGRPRDARRHHPDAGHRIPRTQA